VPFIKKKKAAADIEPQLMTVGKDFNKKQTIYLTEQTLPQFLFPGCCNPIPGDDILGYINNQQQIEIHRRDCKVANKLKTSFGNRIVDADWKMGNSQMHFDAKIEMSGIDRIGILKEVTMIISDQMNVNIHKVEIVCDNGIFNGKFDLRVRSRDDLHLIIKELKKISDIKELSEL